LKKYRTDLEASSLRAPQITKTFKGNSVKLERQMAWPCRDCAVRATNFCGTLIGRTPASPPTEKEQISQVFFTAKKSEIIQYETRRPSSGPYVLCEGWAYRIYRFPDGRRQILSVLIPGDLFFTSVVGNAAPQFSVQSATDIQFCELSRDDTKSEIAGKPSTFDAFKRLCMQDSRESVATLTNFNEQNFAKRVENFVRGIVERLTARGIKIAADVYPFPLTQTDIADATGLDEIEINRAIQFLRAERIIDLLNGELTILNLEKFEGRASTPIRHDITTAISHSEIRLL
jgi:CRP-like cAMP-binding protein